MMMGHALSHLKCGVSCPMSVYRDRVGCQVLCLYTVRGGVSCPVSVYCDRMGCHVLRM